MEIMNTTEAPAASETFPLLYFAIFYPTLAVAILFGNLLTITAVGRSYKLKTLQNAGIVNLAVSDGLVGVFMLISGALGFLDQGKVLCIFSVSTLCFCMSVSLLTLGFVTVERYISIGKPLQYQEFITKKIVTIALLSIWIWSFLMSFGVIFWHHFDETGKVCRIEIFPAPLAILSMILPVCLVTPTIIIMYLIIFKIAYRHSKQIQSLQTADKDQQLNLTSNLKAAKIIALIVGTFAFSWLPFLTTCGIQIFAGNRSKLIIWINDITLQLVFINSAINPIIYAWKNEDFRDQFRKMLCCKNVK